MISAQDVVTRMKSVCRKIHALKTVGLLCFCLLLSYAMGATTQETFAAGHGGATVDSELEKLEKIAVWVKNDAELKNAVKKPDLRAIVISDNVTNSGLSALKNCKNLVYLRFHFAEIGDAGASNISSLTKLKYLIFHDGDFTGNITDKGLSNLVSLRNLRILEIADMPDVTDNGLKYVASLTNLCRLTWRGTSIKGAGLINLNNTRSLYFLDLSCNLDII